MAGLKFTPLEFETHYKHKDEFERKELKFTPLEFETRFVGNLHYKTLVVKIYSVGVWNIGEGEIETYGTELKFTPLEFETSTITVKPDEQCEVKIYSVGVWNSENISELETVSES